jgi:hypothetical protein
MAAGLMFGLGGSIWVQRKVKAVAARYSPSGRAGEAATRARGLPGDVKAAIQEGRLAMRQRESELRAKNGAHLSPTDSHGERRPERP